MENRLLWYGRGVAFFDRHEIEAYKKKCIKPFTGAYKLKTFR